MERIVPSITVLDLLNYKNNKELAYINRFKSSFLRIINKIDKKIINKMYVDLEKALEEHRHIDELIFKQDTTKSLDNEGSNMIIIDYDPNNGKFKFGLIDYKGVLSSSF